MHELAIVQGIVDICEQHAAGRPVRLVVVEIGTISGVVPEALEFSFEAVTAGTLLAGARLEIERIEAAGFCADCRKTVPIASFIEPCPDCGACPLEIRSGEEMRVKYLEVD